MKKRNKLRHTIQEKKSTCNTFKLKWLCTIQICVGTQESQMRDKRKEDEQVCCIHTYHGCAVGLKDSTWKKVEVIFLVSHNNGVACIVPTLNVNCTLLKRLIRSCKNKPGFSLVQLKKMLIQYLI